MPINNRVSVSVTPEIKHAVQRHIYPFYSISDWASQAMVMKLKTYPECSMFYGDHMVSKRPNSIILIDSGVHESVKAFCEPNKINISWWACQALFERLLIDDVDVSRLIKNEDLLSLVYVDGKIIHNREILSIITKPRNSIGEWRYFQTK